MLLMSWISTTRVDSPDQPRLLLADTMNRAPGSITAKRGKKSTQRDMTHFPNRTKKKKCARVNTR